MAGFSTVIGFRIDGRIVDEPPRLLIIGDPFRLIKAEQEALDLKREYCTWHRQQGLGMPDQLAESLVAINAYWEERDARAAAASE